MFWQLNICVTQLLKLCAVSFRTRTSHLIHILPPSLSSGYTCGCSGCGRWSGLLSSPPTSSSQALAEEESCLLKARVWVQVWPPFRWLSPLIQWSCWQPLTPMAFDTRLWWHLWHIPPHDPLQASFLQAQQIGNTATPTSSSSPSLQNWGPRAWIRSLLCPLPQLPCCPSLVYFAQWPSQTNEEQDIRLSFWNKTQTLWTSLLGISFLNFNF